MNGRLVVLLAVVLLLAAYFGTGLHRHLGLEAIKGQLATLQALRSQHPLWTGLAFFGIYVLTAALSLPGATPLTLLAGALFGMVWGSVIASFASSAGALLAFLASRYLFRDAVQGRYGLRLAAINEGLARDGALYLFTIRLIPAFPYFLVNLLMGLTRLRASTFYWVSQLGMLPWTVVAVSIGTGLATLSKPAQLFSVRLLPPVAALALLPWIARRLLLAWRARQALNRWRRPAHFDRNLVVIGAGAAGLVTSYIAAATKARVTLVESVRMGGDCLNYGCVPSKALIKSARMAQEVRRARDYGLKAESTDVDFKAVINRVRDAIGAVAPHDSVERYTGLGVDVVVGHARIVDPWTVEIATTSGATQRLTTRNIVIASGASPAVPDVPGIKDSGYVTSETLWDALSSLERPPGRVAVLGGGPIGTELAQALARLGSAVIQIERGPRLLGREDPDVSAAAQAALEADGVEVLIARELVECTREGAQRCLVVRGPGGLQRIAYDLLICAVGRRARLCGFGLEELGVPTTGTLETNEYLQTRLPTIFAAGDVTGPYQFTHVAAHQAWYAAVNALFGSLRRFKVDYRVIPRVTFTDPEIGRVGMNETEARAAAVDHEVTRFELAELDRAIADGAAHGFVKVLTARGSDQILGVCIVGERAGDLLAEFVLAMRWKLGLKKILGTIHAYPTYAEASKYAAGAWQRRHLSARVLAIAERYHRWRRS